MAQDDSTAKPEQVIVKERLPDVAPEQQRATEVSPVVEVVEKSGVVESVEPAEVSHETESVTESVESTEQESTQPEEQPVAEPIMQKVVAVQPVVPKKNKFEAGIEEVLQEDLTDLYLSMTPEDRKAFKIKGEETVSMIHTLVRVAHINTKKIFQLIRTWLQMIPGVNRFFLEQEAKIKTDKVLLVTEEEKRRGSKDVL